MLKKTLTKTLQLILFFILTFLFSWILWLFPLLNSHDVKVPQIFLAFGNLANLGPAIIAFLLYGIIRGSSGVRELIRNAWNWHFNKIWLLAILLLPVVITGLALILKLLVEKGSYTPGYPYAGLPLFAIMLLFTGGPLEEFGWRGFALPLLLEKFPALTASLILGLFHGLWHLPLHFIEGSVQSAIPIWEFIVVTIVGAIIYTWIYQNAGGSLMAMILHHWAGNFACAVFVYWNTSIGRWIFLGIQLLVSLSIVFIYKGRNFYSNVNQVPKNSDSIYQ